VWCWSSASGSGPWSRDGGVRSTVDGLIPPAIPVSVEFYPTIGSEVGPLAFSADGRTLVFADRGNQGLEAWDLTRGQRISSPRFGLVEHLAMDSRAEVVATTAYRFPLRVWQVGDGFDLTAVTLTDQPTVNATDGGPVALSADGTTVAAVTSGGVALWDLATGARSDLRGSGVTALAFAPDGRLAVAQGGSVSIWRGLEKTRTISGLPVPATALTFSHDGELLVVGGADGDTSFLWVYDERGPRLSLDQIGPVASVSISADGALVAVGLANGSGADEDAPAVRLWSVATGKGMSMHINDAVAADNTALRCHKDAAVDNFVAFSPVEPRLAVGCRSGVRIWRLSY